MPLKKQGVTSNKAAGTAIASELVSSFQLYRDSTGQVPIIIVNLVRADKYQQSINNLRDILSVEENRKNNVLIELKVRTSDNKGNTDIASFPTFYMRCSDLYIVGCKYEENIVIFQDSELHYLADVRGYNFRSAYVHSSIEGSSLHAMGYVIAEAVRFPYIEKKILKLIEEERYVLNIDENVFDILELAPNDHDIKLNKIIDQINSILNEFTAYKISHGNWGFEKEKGIKTGINKLFKKLGIYYKGLLSASKGILDKYSSVLAKATDTVNEAKYFKDLLSNEEEDSEYESEEEGVNSEERAEDVNINIVTSLFEIELELDVLHERLELTEVIRTEEEDKELWEDITEAQCRWSYLNAIKKLGEIIQFTKSIEGVYEHLSNTETTISQDAKVAVNPSNSTLCELAAGVYTLSEDGYYSASSEKLPCHSALFYNNYLDDNDKGGGAIHIKYSSKENKVDTTTSILFSYYLSWLQNLPLWLQNQILNSSPIKILIESLKQNSAIDKPKSITEDFYDKMFHIEDGDNSADSPESDALKAHVSDSNRIDMNIKLTVFAGVCSLLLPTMIESGGDILGKASSFSGDYSDAILQCSEII